MVIEFLIFEFIGAGLKFVAQIHTAGGYIKDGQYIYCSSCTVEDHVESFRAQVSAALGMDPVMINVHSGHDSWRTSAAVCYFKQVLAVEKEIVSSSATVVVHETHRQRLLFNPFQAIEILSDPDLADLKINADLSHWVCCCERLFDDEERDPWWPGLLDNIAQRCHLIHARIGHAEGPQIVDPRRTDLFEKEISAHLSWWECIWKHQRSRGLECAYVEAEHGPEPYQSYLSSPMSGDAAATTTMSEAEKGEILWELNAHVISLVEERFGTNSSSA